MESRGSLIVVLEIQVSVIWHDTCSNAAVRKLGSATKKQKETFDVRSRYQSMIDAKVMWHVCRGYKLQEPGIRTVANYICGFEEIRMGQSTWEVSWIYP